MRRTLTLAVSVILLVSVAGPALAATNGQSYEQGSPGERDPSCTAQDTKQSNTIVIDGRAIPGVESPVPITVPVTLDFTIQDDGEEKTVLRACGGEHWDSQDPNSRDSSSDTRANESDGNVYVNPLGDCSSWNSNTGRADGDKGEGCPGGTDRPSRSELVHIRVTGDAPGTASGDSTTATTYQNLEIWGVGRAATSVHADHENHNGWVALYLEDHSDQIIDDIAGDPLGENDGNYLTIPFDPIFGGSSEEGDCTSETYQSDSKCARDNTAATVEFGYDWLPWNQAPSANAGGPNALP